MSFIGHLKICDFGLSKMTHFATTLAGSPMYTAPEVTMKRPYTCAVDVWSFGIVLMEMILISVTSVFPHQFLEHEVLESQQKLPELSEIIKSTLVLDPEKRLSSQQLLAMITPLVTDVKEDIILLQGTELRDLKPNIAQKNIFKKSSPQCSCACCLNISKLNTQVSTQLLTNELVRIFGTKIVKLSEYEGYYHVTFETSEVISKVLLHNGSFSCNNNVFRATPVVNGIIC